jgi:hypothetical protein
MTIPSDSIERIASSWQAYDQGLRQIANSRLPFVLPPRLAALIVSLPIAGKACFLIGTQVWEFNGW